MQIRCKGYLTFRELIGECSLELEGESPSLGDFLEALCTAIGEELRAALFDPGTNELDEHIAVLLNGRHYTHLPERLDTPLQDGDEVAIFPPIAGGAIKN